MSVNLIGEREWGDLYEFVEIVRIPELLDYYRKQGMPLLNYLKCKNFSANFSNYLFNIIRREGKKGLQYLDFKKTCFDELILSKCLYFTFIFPFAETKNNEKFTLTMRIFF